MLAFFCFAGAFFGGKNVPRDLYELVKTGKFKLGDKTFDMNVGAKEGIKPVGAESGTLFIQRAGKALR